MLKKLKDNQNKNFTTDANGNIILIKGTGIEKLQGEFFFPKLNVLDKATIPPQNLPGLNQKIADRKESPSRERLPSSKSKINQKVTNLNKKSVNNEYSNIGNITLGSFNNLINTNNNSNINPSTNNQFNNVSSYPEKDKFSFLPAGSSFE
jgi:hypothetical protein